MGFLAPYLRLNLNKTLKTDDKGLDSYYLVKCQDPDLNWRHEDFQSTALPTELSRLTLYIKNKLNSSV